MSDKFIPDDGNRDDQAVDPRFNQALATSTVALGSGFSSRVMARIMIEKLRKAKIESTISSLLLGAAVIVSAFVLFLFFSYFEWFQFKLHVPAEVTSVFFVAVNTILPCVLAMIALFGLDTLAIQRRQNLT
ncbi:MAG: hypothetical protein ABGY96_15710 [bacterium]|nr:hypothetical protein [Gammaproteobacteria bacterium]HIL98924.1 hypothetical protein [Pseudomonadales bacterium]